MWAALKARLRGEAAKAAAPPEPTAAPAASPPPAPATPPAAPAARAAGTAPAAGAPSRSDDELFTEGMLGRRMKEGTIDDVLDDLEIVMLQSDVALPVVERMRRDLRKELAGRKLKFGVEAEEAIRACLERSARQILAQPPIDLPAAIRARANKPFVILFVGVNGTGKTTTIAKLAGWLRAQGLSSVIAAGDTFRAGAIEQLLVHGERLGIRVVRQQEGSDPAAVAFDAVEHARAKRVDVVLIDTAGRQHTNENLIDEAKKIRRVVQPSMTLFVGDALSGNDVVEQARQFNAALGIDGLILTKLDADAKGGAALSTTFVTKKPILFVGLGQEYGDLRPFDPGWMAHRLFAEGTAG
ncbi:MAG TPA: signal recognition particle-docking protein FtsY [Thermoplasmata archaeon]|nr:signal recognition particle-docking protein FtsY [Thermoplasmata archaeon]